MQKIFEIIRQTRENFAALMSDKSLEILNRIPAGFSNNMVWNYGHILTSQQNLCYRASGLEALIPESYFAHYARGTRPHGRVSASGMAQITNLLRSTAFKLEEDYSAGRFQAYQPFMTIYGVQLDTIEDAIQFIATHEALHYGIARSLYRVASTAGQFVAVPYAAVTPTGLHGASS
jgi:hypothetical protein